MDEILGAALGVLAVQTGKLVIRLFSFGTRRSEALFGEEGRIYGAAGALSFVRDGQRVITQTGQLFVGFAFYAILLLAIIAVFSVI
jgi:hypothetical protein